MEEFWDKFGPLIFWGVVILLQTIFGKKKPKKQKKTRKAAPVKARPSSRAERGPRPEPLRQRVPIPSHVSLEDLVVEEGGGVPDGWTAAPQPAAPVAAVAEAGTRPARRAPISQRLVAGLILNEILAPGRRVSALGQHCR